MNIEELKELLGISDSSKDGLLLFAMMTTKDVICNFCNIEEIPNGLMSTAYRMAMDVFRRESLGTQTAETVTSITVGDTSTTFGSTQASTDYSDSLLKDYKMQLRRYRRVVF